MGDHASAQNKRKPSATSNGIRGPAFANPSCPSWMSTTTSHFSRVTVHNLLDGLRTLHTVARDHHYVALPDRPQAAPAACHSPQRPAPAASATAAAAAVAPASGAGGLSSSSSLSGSKRFDDMLLRHVDKRSLPNQALGVSLEFLWETARHVPASWSLQQVCECIIKPATLKQPHKSFCELPGLVHARYLGPPHFHVVAHRQDSWHGTVAGVQVAWHRYCHSAQGEAVLRERGEPGEILASGGPYIYLDVLCKPQHTGNEPGLRDEASSLCALSKRVVQTWVMVGQRGEEGVRQVDVLYAIWCAWYWGGGAGSHYQPPLNTAPSASEVHQHVTDWRREVLCPLTFVDTCSSTRGFADFHAHLVRAAASAGLQTDAALCEQHRERMLGQVLRTCTVKQADALIRTAIKLVAARAKVQRIQADPEYLASLDLKGELASIKTQMEYGADSGQCAALVLMRQLVLRMDAAAPELLSDGGEGEQQQGLLEALVSLPAQAVTRFESPDVQLDAAHVLCALSSLPHPALASRIAGHPGLMGMMVAVLMSSQPNLLLLEQVLWTLGNLAGDSAALRDACIRAGVVEGAAAACVRVMDNAVAGVDSAQRGKVLSQAAFLLHNLNRFSPPAPAFVVRRCWGLALRLGPLLSGDERGLGDVLALLLGALQSPGALSVELAASQQRELTDLVSAHLGSTSADIATACAQLAVLLAGKGFVQELVSSGTAAGLARLLHQHTQAAPTASSPSEAGGIPGDASGGGLQLPEAALSAALEALTHVAAEQQHKQLILDSVLDPGLKLLAAEGEGSLPAAKQRMAALLHALAVQGSLTPLQLRRVCRSGAPSAVCTVVQGALRQSEDPSAMHYATLAVEFIGKLLSLASADGDTALLHHVRRALMTHGGETRNTLSTPAAVLRVLVRTSASGAQSAAAAAERVLSEWGVKEAVQPGSIVRR